MQRMTSQDDKSRPSPVNTNNTKSFARYEPISPPSSQSSRYPHGSSTPKTASPQSPAEVKQSSIPERTHSDIFETQDDDDEEPAAKEEDMEESFPEGFDELPIEIQSLMERFLESLSLKTQSSSLSMGRLAELYQNFYMHVETQIATHIAILSSRIARERSPAPSVSSASSANSRGPRKKASLGKEPRDSDQQMLTASDMADRKKTRRQLELKRIALEEAVERGICERVYPRLWRHSSTEDGERDAKLRSRAAALAIVGVDLKELLSTAMTDDDGKGPDLSTAAKKEQEAARTQLAGARESLQSMNDARYPQGKLAALTVVHTKVVDFLSQMFPSTSSADEILPTLIYVIITSAPGTINVVANMLFIQRFRNVNKLDGETAYCLTNLEAAISFLETVDLSSIRRDELPEGPSRTATNEGNGSRPSTPRSTTTSDPPTFSGLPPTLDPTNNRSQSPSSSKHPRRLSSLIGTKPGVPQPFTAASDMVSNTADTVHAALDNSFKFLFGRLRERQATASPTFSTASGALGPEPPTPRTLADARRLVTERADGIDSEEVSLHEALALPLIGPEAPPKRAPEGSPANGGKMLELISGRRATTDSANSTVREGSVGSTRSDSSAGSFRPAAAIATRPNGRPLPVPVTAAVPIPGTDGSIASQAADATTAVGTPPAIVVASSQSFGAVESMRKFGDSLNPLKGFSMRGFGGGVGGRSLSGSHIVSPANAVAQPVAGEAQNGVKAAEPSQGVTAEEDARVHGKAEEVNEEKIDLSGIAAPVQRFVDLKDARELNGFEVEFLLRDYQRLAGALRVLRS